METFIIALIVLGAVVVIVGILIALVSPVLSAALERRAAAKGRLVAESPYRTHR
jgi:type II secretory pathway pseudopilin PulG